MSEPARCAHLLPAVAPVAADAGRPLALVDIGTGAGFALHLDAYATATTATTATRSWSARPDAPVTLHTDAARAAHPGAPGLPVPVAIRIGIDTEPLDVGDPSVRAWLRACTPPVAEALGPLRPGRRPRRRPPRRPGARRRAERAAEVVEGLPAAPTPACWTPTSTCSSPEEQARFRDQMAALGRRRDLDWISLDPLVPLGAVPRESVLGAPLPPGLLERAEQEGVFGVLERVAYRRAARRAGARPRAPGGGVARVAGLSSAPARSRVGPCSDCSSRADRRGWCAGGGGSTSSRRLGSAIARYASETPPGKRRDRLGSFVAYADQTPPAVAEHGPVATILPLRGPR